MCVGAGRGNTSNLGIFITLLEIGMSGLSLSMNEFAFKKIKSFLHFFLFLTESVTKMGTLILEFFYH